MATVSSTVELLIKAQQPQRALRALSEATNKLKNSIDATQGSFNRTGQSASKSAAKASTAYKSLGTEVSGVNNIVRTLRNSFVALGGAVTASGILQSGIDAIEAERKIKLLSASSGDTAEALEIASRAASQFGLSSTEANAGVARLLARLKPMGVSLEDIESTFAGFNIAAKLAGATASESSGAFLQLTQALGSGVLRGQELNSILEQAPLIATAIALEMDTTTGSLKKLGEEGKITSQIVLAALKRIETEGAEKLEEAMRGPAQQFKNLRNAGVELSKVLAKNVLPAIIPLVQGATNLLKSFNELPAGIQTFIVSTTLATGAVVALNKAIAILAASKLGAFLAQQIALFQVFGAKIYFAAAAAGALKIAMAALPFGAVALGVGLLTTALINNNRQQKEFNDLIKFGGEEALKAAIKVEQLRKTQAQQRIDEAGPTGRMGKNSPFQKRMRRIIADADERIAKLQKRAGEIKPDPKIDNIIDTSDEEKNRLQKIRQQAVAAKERLFESQQELAILRETNADEKIRLEFAAERANLQRDYASLISDAKSDEERLNLVAALRNDLQRLSLEQNIAITDEIEKRTKTFSDQLAHQDEMNQLLQSENLIFEQIGQTIQDGLVRGIEDAITGAKSLSESLSGILKSVGGMLLRQGISSLIGSIGGGGGGGFGVTPLTSGMNFFSAEGGYASGATRAVVGEAGPEYVIPESKMRESMARYARGARGSAVIPENGEGGTNSEGGGVSASTLDVRFNVERINSVDYVTASEFQAGMQQAAAQGAQRGQQAALRRLQQSPSTRRRVGI